jgi:hypothetical protein
MRKVIQHKTNKHDRLEFEYRNLVFRKDSDKFHCFYVYDCPNACRLHAEELRQDKPHLDFMPVSWRLDVHAYSVLPDFDDPDDE